MSDYLAVNARISAPAMARLKQLSSRLNQSYGEVLSNLLLAVPVESADWEAPLQAMQARMDELEARLNAMQAGTPPVGAVGAHEGQGIAESQSEECAAETGVEAGLSRSGDYRDEIDSMENEQGIPSHPVQAPAPAKLPAMDIPALELARQGFGPTAIAKELTSRGYRTESGNPITKGHGTIARVCAIVKRGK